MRRICIRVLAGTIAVGAAASAAGAGRPMRFEELAKVARVGGFDVSPDGRWIAVSSRGGEPRRQVKSAVFGASAG